MKTIGEALSRIGKQVTGEISGMFSDHDILQENRAVLLRRHRALVESTDVDLSLLGLTPQAGQELRSLSNLQAERAADAAAPLFNFPLEDQIIRALSTHQAAPMIRQSRLEAEIQDDALLMLTNRWISARHGPAYSGTVLGLTRRMIEAFAAATYSDLRRVAAAGLRPRLNVKHQYIFHAARNLTMHTTQRTNLAVCNSRSHAF